MDSQQAAAESARRRVRRAAGLLKEATRDLAAAVDGQTSLGTVHVHDASSAESARDLIALGVGRHGAVDVIVIARPTRRAGSTPTTALTGEGEAHGTHQTGHPGTRR